MKRWGEVEEDISTVGSEAEGVVLALNGRSSKLNVESKAYGRVGEKHEGFWFYK
jgi:hypothetical protein